MKHNLFVFDTNTLISASLIAGSVNALALDKAFRIGKVVISEATFTEFTEVIFREKFDLYLSWERRLEVLNKFDRDTIKYSPSNSLSVYRDPKDNKFLELAACCRASCIITGDKDLLVLNPFEQIPIISPKDFLQDF